MDKMEPNHESNRFTCTDEFSRINFLLHQLSSPMQCKSKSHMKDRRPCSSAQPQTSIMNCKEQCCPANPCCSSTPSPDTIRALESTTCAPPPTFKTTTCCIADPSALEKMKTYITGLNYFYTVRDKQKSSIYKHSRDCRCDMCMHIAHFKNQFKTDFGTLSPSNCSCTNIKKTQAKASWNKMIFDMSLAMSKTFGGVDPCNPRRSKAVVEPYMQCQCTNCNKKSKKQFALNVIKEPPYGTVCNCKRLMEDLDCAFQQLEREKLCCDEPSITVTKKKVGGGGTGKKKSANISKVHLNVLKKLLRHCENSLKDNKSCCFCRDELGKFRPVHAPEYTPGIMDVNTAEIKRSIKTQTGLILNDFQLVTLIKLLHDNSEKLKRKSPKKEHEKCTNEATKSKKSMCTLPTNRTYPPVHDCVDACEKSAASMKRKNLLYEKYDCIIPPPSQSEQTEKKGKKNKKK